MEPRAGRQPAPYVCLTAAYSHGALSSQGNAPAKAIFLVSNLMILTCIPFRLNGDKKTEEAILVFAVPGSWFLLMFFAGYVTPLPPLCVF